MMTRRSTGKVRVARSLWYARKGVAELRTARLAPPAPGEACVRTLFSGISRGTERLVFEGGIGQSEWERMRCPMQEGAFPFPVKYGYCATGVVEDGPAELVGRQVFCLHPHQDFFTVPITALAPIPDDVPLRRATLAANMETALNAVWDSGAGPGDRIVVVGAGVVGLLVASLAARLPGAVVTAVDTDESRRPRGGGSRRGVCPAGARTGRCRRRVPCQRHRRRPQHRHQLRRARGHHRGNELVRQQAGAGRPRRRVPQPPSEARVLPGRHGLAGPARRAGTTAAAWRRRCACSPSRRSMRWWRRRSPSTMRRGACRKSLHRARMVLPQLSATRIPDTSGDTHVRR